MYSKLRFLELQITSLRQKKFFFFIELSKVLEVAKFRFLTLPILHKQVLPVLSILIKLGKLHILSIIYLSHH